MACNPVAHGSIPNSTTLLCFQLPPSASFLPSVCASVQEHSICKQPKVPSSSLLLLPLSFLPTPAPVLESCQDFLPAPLPRTLSVQKLPALLPRDSHSRQPQRPALPPTTPSAAPASPSFWNLCPSWFSCYWLLAPAQAPSPGSSLPSLEHWGSSAPGLSAPPTHTPCSISSFSTVKYNLC